MDVWCLDECRWTSPTGHWSIIITFGAQLLTSFLTHRLNTQPSLSLLTSAIMAVITRPPVSVVRDIKAEHALDFDATYDDWRADLIRDGYAVIKGAIPKQRAEQYVEQVHDFLESV